MSPENLKSGDTDELEALFDEISDQKVWEGCSDASANPESCEGAEPTQAAEQSEVSAEQPADSETTPDEDGTLAGTDLSEIEPLDADDPNAVFQRVGAMTRKLHDSLRELGYDKNIEAAVGALPDARARLNYIAKLTEDAANKVLGSVETVQTINDELAAKAKELDEKWDKLFNNELSLEEFKESAKETHAFIKSFRDQSNVFSSQFTEIIMSQDFQDLTGQVINKVATMAQSFEEQLVYLLLQTTPEEQRKNVENQFLNGPAIDAEGRTDICSDQGQVDDLLESLGF